MKKIIASTILCSLLRAGFAADDTAAPATNAAPTEFPVTIRIDAGKVLGPCIPTWRFFGYDEANYTYMKDGKKLLSELGEMGGSQVYVRCHHLLTSGDGSPALKWGSTGAYTEDADGKPIYSWTILDKIFDTYLERGLKPYAQLGFMPEALSTHPENYPHNPPTKRRAPADAGQAYPPKDYAKWGDLANAWTQHCVDEYGRAEVEKWYWEVWNEPNIFYWHGSREDYFKLYDYAVDGVRRALPTARVGGPETAGGNSGRYLHDFLEHCAHGTNYVTGKIGTPVDFISFHAKGAPVFTNDHVRMGMANQFRDINGAFSAVAAFPEYKKTPLIIGESDPEGCAACNTPEDGYRNGTMYSSYTAASFSHEFELADRYGINFEGALTWAFEFEDQSYFAGFRALASGGLDLPVLNVFRMFAKMSGQRVGTESSGGLAATNILYRSVRGNPDVSAFATLDKNKMCVMAWYYHDDDLPGPDAVIDLTLDSIPLKDGKATLTQYRVDADHSNSYSAWKRMGSPKELTPEQYTQLEQAGKLAQLGGAESVQIANSQTAVHFKLPRQGVAMFVLEWH